MDTIEEKDNVIQEQVVLLVQRFCCPNRGGSFSIKNRKRVDVTVGATLQDLDVLLGLYEF
ncbi:hypothetical protein [Paraliobacillus ryukyuensis]|uniref:hypothetical protein n=1 Tax=Paraliobacillus ryukyuensis TaxID=200904 RepID=UPI000DE9BEC4